MKRCSCKYATSRNRASVRNGYEMGGYVIEECHACKVRRGTFAKRRGVSK